MWAGSAAHAGAAHANRASKNDNGKERRAQALIAAAMKWFSCSLGLLCVVVLFLLRGSSTPAPGSGIFNAASASCAVSYEGVVWYRVPIGTFSPIDVRRERCAPEVLSRVASVLPGWARPHARTKAIFVATSLQEWYSVSGMHALESIASRHRVPMTWLVGNEGYVVWNTSWYRDNHMRNGDSIETTDRPVVIRDTRARFPWFARSVDVSLVGSKRLIPDPRRGEPAAFWGIAWNSRGVDGTFDYGAPWGAYCADPASYKRPDPSGACALLGFEWTARDLTRAYLSGHEEYFSTDPDDLRRAGFGTSAACVYVRAVMDAYAAAGEREPLIVISQQESAEEPNAGDDAVMNALYGRAVESGMRVMTLARAARVARIFAMRPRAIAFPFIPGGMRIPSALLDDAVLYPATIDYHDTRVGMTFLAGHLLPTRVFRYADYSHSATDVPLPELAPRAVPALIGAKIGNGAILLRWKAPEAVRYGVAFWSNPDILGFFGSDVTRAGRAGAVVTFDLRAGENQIIIPCGACVGDVLPYAG
jgi:hypothetical protein